MGTTARAEVPLVRDLEDGALTLRFADGPLPTPAAPPAVLGADETRALLAGLEPLPAEPGGSPIVPPASLPPPRAGAPARPVDLTLAVGAAVADAPIAPRAAPVTPLAEPLITPTGEVREASQILVRFDQPMIDVGAVGAAPAPPATISPAVPGAWRWLDTRVAAFTPAGKLPGATRFTVTVAAGARAVSGSALAAPASATFETAPVMVRAVYPASQLRPDGAIAVVFDQAIDPATIAQHLRVDAGKRRIELVPVTLDEARARWAKNPAFSFDAAQLGPHHVLLAPKTAWPAGSELVVTLTAGAPSREGPVPTKLPTAAMFETVPPLGVLSVDCGTAKLGTTCPTDESISIVLSNPHRLAPRHILLDGAPAFEKDPGWLAVSVPHPAGAAHVLELAPDLADAYGQTLGRTVRYAFTGTRPVAQPELDAPSGLFVLDPRFQIPQWIVEAAAVPALRVQLYRVEPRDYFAYRAFERGARATPPGTRVTDHTHAVGARMGSIARVDLRPALGPAGTGHVVAVATARGLREVAWIQVSKLGVTARIDGEKLSAWVHQLDAGKLPEPRAGVATALLVERAADPAATASTDATGNARLALPVGTPTPAPARREPDGALVVATSATDSVFFVLDEHERAVRHHEAQWFVTDDRFTYRPGETLYVKGWVRWTHDGVDPQLALPAPTDTITYSLVDARGAKLASGTAPLTGHGGFDLELAIPPNANLGTAYLELATRDERHSHPIALQEFKTPTFAVEVDGDVTHHGSVPLIAGEAIELAATARYFGGGGLAGATVRWSARLHGALYTPPGWDGFSFDPISPEGDRYRRYRRAHRGTVEGASTMLSGASASRVVVGIPAVPAGGAGVLSAEVTVTDVDRQVVRVSSAPVLVHPAAYYVGLRGGAPGQLELAVTDIAGTAVAGVAIDVTITGAEWDLDTREPGPVRDTQRCTVTSAARPVTCAWIRRDDELLYTATARITDARGRPASAELVVPRHPRARSVTADLALRADRERYAIGDVARVTIASAQVPARAVVTFARQGIVAQRAVELAAAETTIELPIEPAHLENVHVVVDRFASARPRAPGPAPLPEHTTAELELRVDPDSARLAVTTRPLRATVAPAEEASFEVEVARRGTPVAGAEVALLVVDEAVLALSRKEHPDPLEPFLRRVDAGTRARTSIDLVRDQQAQLAGTPGFERWSLDERGFARGGRGGMRGRTAAVPSVSIGQPSAAGGRLMTRKDFRPTAVWSPRLVTDARGRATVRVKMPDNLTRYRIVAFAAADTRYFGKAESSIAVRQPLVVRAAPPRFLTQGDRFELPVVVQNLDDRARAIDVAVRASVLAGAPEGRRVTLPAGARTELRFAFAAPRRGRATIQTIARSEALADASAVEVAVYEPATTEAFATYGIVDDTAAHARLVVPAEVYPEVGGVEIELAASQLASLTDAFWYLQAYPHECAEQRSSRMLATTAMAEVLDAFAAPGRPSRDALLAQRALDVERLAADQNHDGGWGYFRDLESDGFVTAQVLAALARSEDRAGMVRKRPSDPRAAAALERAVKLVGARVDAARDRLERAARTPIARRERFDIGLEVSLTAFELDALAATGRDVRATARRLDAAAVALGTYPIDARAIVLGLLARDAGSRAARERLVRELAATIRESAAAATVEATYGPAERDLLVSPARSAALVLGALIREAPDHPAIPKLARGLLDGRKRGRWTSTQENLVVLQALRRYFDAYEAAAPRYAGRLWLGSTGFAERAFTARDHTAAVRVGWDRLAAGSGHDVVLDKTGTGRLYYRIAVTYAPKQADLPALDAGFVVRRSYEALDAPGDVTRLPDGSYRIRLGARVRVTLEATTTLPRHAVALVDPLAAGLEPINARLAGSDRAEDAIDPVFEHVNLRGQRAEAFAMRLPAGSHRFAYTTRATTPGTFLAAPAKAEEMYSPETFGRSRGTRVVIE